MLEEVDPMPRDSVAINSEDLEEIEAIAEKAYEMDTSGAFKKAVNDIRDKLLTMDKSIVVEVKGFEI